MMSVKKIGKNIFIAALFGVVLYSAVYFMATNSEAFEFIEYKIKNSKPIQIQVGSIQKVRPSLLGAYDQRTVGANEWVSMTIYVNGEKRSLEFDVRAKKINGTWTVESIISGEQKFQLD